MLPDRVAVRYDDDDNENDGNCQDNQPIERDGQRPHGMLMRLWIPMCHVSLHLATPGLAAGDADAVRDFLRGMQDHFLTLGETSRDLDLLTGV